MLGGKYVGEGSYGCVFTPVLKCADKPQTILNPSDNLSYSKITVSKDAKYEFSICKRISEIPIWRNYFVISESICQPAKITDKDKTKCSIIDEKKLSELKMMNMEYGGVSLSNYSYNLDTFDLMGFITHLVAGGALLNLYGIVHTDLHNGNILVNNVPRIIDFNLSIDMKNIDIHPHRHDDYYQEPPDSTIANVIAKGGYNIDKIIASIIDKKEILNKIVNILQVSRADMHTSLNNFYNTDNLEINTWFNNHWSKIDSWSIGVIILKIIDLNSNSTKFEPILRKHKSVLFPMLKRLVAVSPVDRIDCVQALNYLNPTHFIIKKYSTIWLNIVKDGNIKG